MGAVIVRSKAEGVGAGFGFGGSLVAALYGFGAGGLEVDDICRTDDRTLPSARSGTCPVYWRLYEVQV